MLEIKHLKKRFGKKLVLKDINLKVNQNDIIGIIGPSGCGKSTFLRCINMLEKPTEGEIIFHDDDIVDNTKLESTRVVKDVKVRKRVPDKKNKND